MTTAPAKPPLHNFPLQFLRWGSKNHTNSSHRFRRPVSAEPEPTDDDRSRVGSRAARHRFFLGSCSSPENAQQQLKPPSPPPPPPPSHNSEEDAEGEAHKPWNLRPRRAPAATTVQKSEAAAVHEAEPKSMRLRGSASAAMAEGPSLEKKKNEKRKFWIALSKDEIEEDIFVMTGSRPARRPKKRPRNVQKQLDNVFPGLWLVGFSADSYRSPGSPTRK